MNTEQQVLLDLLKSSLFHTPVVFPDHTNWDKVLEIAKEQAVIALASPSVPEEHSKDWKSFYPQHITHYTRVLYEQNELVQLLQGHSIPMVILKGTAAAVYYPTPHLRAMGDIDLLVSADKVKEAQRIMADNGYRYISDIGRHIEYIKGGVVFELHRRFSSEWHDIEETLSPGLGNPKMYQIGKYSFPGLPPNQNGIVLLEHILHHLKESGIGLRQIIDWMMFVHNELTDEVWEEEFRALAQETGLEKLAVTITHMCRKWIGLPDTITWCNGADEDLADKILEHLFIDGNFGRQKPVTERTSIIIRREGLFFFLQRAGLEHWSAVQKYPFLRPFAWIYQIARYIRKVTAGLIHGEKMLGGIKTGKGKEEILKGIGFY